jgi:hypothetical protein
MLPIVQSQVFVYTPNVPAIQQAATICSEKLQLTTAGILEYQGTKYFLNAPGYASTGVLVGAVQTTELTPNARQLALIKRRHADNQCADL